MKIKEFNNRKFFKSKNFAIQFQDWEPCRPGSETTTRRTSKYFNLNIYMS